VVQELFLYKIPDILRKNPTISMDELGRLLIVTSRNTSIDVYRRRKKATTLPQDDILSLGTSAETHTQLDLKRTMEELEPRYQEVLTFKYLWGMTWLEVSKKMGLSIQGVRKRAGKALSLFKSKLDR